MAISFHPRAGTLLMCDFEGFREPEMVKLRPVVVISPDLPDREKLVAVVPLSTTPPIRQQPFHYLLSKHYDPLDNVPIWAKCDMIVNVGLWRLNGFKIGRREWLTPRVLNIDLDGIKAGVLAGLGFPKLTNQQEDPTL